MTEPTFSIVTPSFNQAKYLEATLQSVLRQQGVQLEYIVVDGASTDGSEVILEKYREKIDHLIIEPDAGQTDALTKGFSLATGDILCWLNSDDLLEQNALKVVADYFRTNPNTEVLFGDASWIDQNGTPIRTKREIPFNRFIWLHDHNYIPQPSTFWRRALYTTVGGLDKSFDLAMDADLWIRFSERTCIQHIRYPLSQMRYHPDQKMQRMRPKATAEDISIRQRYGVPTSGIRWHLRHLYARALRIAWKATTGCYGRHDG